MDKGQSNHLSRLFTSSGDPLERVNWKRFDVVITGRDGSEVFKQDNVEFPSFWSQQAVNITTSKYFKGHVGQLDREVSFKEVVNRVVSTITGWGVVQGYFESDEREVFEGELTHILVHQMAAFNSPVWFNFGVDDHPMASACFINSVQDNMESIMDLARKEAFIFKGGSGAGVNLSNLRAGNEKLSKGGIASGPLSFMSGLDAFSGAIRSGGRVRRAAKIVILDVDHPDIMKFIRCKEIEEEKARVLVAAGYDDAIDGASYKTVDYQNANNSVRVTDQFMQAVVNGDMWTAKNRLGGDAWSAPARDILHTIASSVWACGDPGLQFDTRINRSNTCPSNGRIGASNPCLSGDVMMGTMGGLKSIKSLVDEGGKWTGKLWTGETFQDSCIWLTGVKRTVTVTLANGVQLFCTPDHRVLVNDKWVSAENLNGLVVKSSLSGAPWCTSIVCFSKVISVSHRSDGEEVYDFSIQDDSHRGWANGLIVHNCGEFHWHDDSACNLASINLSKFYDGSSFLTGEFIHTVRVLITAMDIIVDNTSYPTEEIRDNSVQSRPLGLGYSSLGGMLMRMGVSYTSSEGRHIAALLTSLMTATAYQRSTELAFIHGPHYWYLDNSDATRQVIHSHRHHHKVLGGTDTSDMCDFADSLYTRCKQLWLDVEDNVSNWGVRNSQLALLAPCGTISYLMDCDTTGVEPSLALLSHKALVGGGLMKLVLPCVKSAAYKLGYSETVVSDIMQAVLNKTPISDHVEDSHLQVFATALEEPGHPTISPNDHLNMVAAVQPFLSGGISKTLNVPNTGTVEDIEQLYIQAWKLGLKGVTCYRDQSKINQPVSVSTGKLPEPARRRLPDDRDGKTHKFSIAGYEGYVTAGMYENGDPGELFLRMAKAGSTLGGFAEGWAIMVSLALQYGVPIQVIINKFEHTFFEPSGFTTNSKIPMTRSILDYVARWLKYTFVEGCDTPPDPLVLDRGLYKLSESGSICSTCGGLMQQSGACYCCINCGSSNGCG